MPKVYRTSKPFKKINIEEENNIIFLYNSGEKIISICKKLNRDRKSIRKILDKILTKNRKSNHKFHITKEIEDEIILLHRSISPLEISKKLDIPISIVRKILKLNNINSNYNQKYIFNYNYFEKIDTPNKAYILGILYADGCIPNNKNAIQLQLKTSDKYILEKISTEIGSNYPLYWCRPVKIKNWSTGSYRLYITNKKAKEDLIKLGCIPRKSLILKFPTKAQVPKELLSHFIRGYFDGDGGITKFNNNFLCKVYILGTLNFLSNIKNILTEINIHSTVKLDKREGNVYVLNISNREKCLRFANFIYKDATIFMLRKFEKFEIWKTLPYDKRKAQRRINN